MQTVGIRGTAPHMDGSSLLEPAKAWSTPHPSPRITPPPQCLLLADAVSPPTFLPLSPRDKMRCCHAGGGHSRRWELKLDSRAGGPGLESQFRQLPSQAQCAHPEKWAHLLARTQGAPFLGAAGHAGTPLLFWTILWHLKIPQVDEPSLPWHHRGWHRAL